MTKISDGENQQEQELAKRVDFDQEATVMSADGTWSRKARLEDIFQTGAKLRIFCTRPERMKSKEFFIVIMPDGRVRRQAKVIWEEKNYVGVAIIGSNST